jgi:chromosome segregation ATPase
VGGAPVSGDTIEERREDAKDRRIAELEKDVTRLEAQLDASVLEDALDSEARLAARVHKLEAERQEWADKRQALEVRIGTKDRRIAELVAERDRLRVALTDLYEESKDWDVFSPAQVAAHAALAGEDRERRLDEAFQARDWQTVEQLQDEDLP